MITSTTCKIAAVLAAVIALAAVTGAAQAGSKPTSMSKAEYRALMIRSDALNQKYHLGNWKVVPQGMTPPEYRALMIRSDALNQKYHLGNWKGVPEGMTPAEYRAITIRGEALNKQYGLGKWSRASAARVSNDSTGGFAWGAFLIGAVAMLGLVLLASGVVVTTRYSDRTARARTS